MEIDREKKTETENLTAGRAGLFRWRWIPETRQNMCDAFIKVTEAALRAVDAARFFQTERGFHGRFYCTLQEQLDQAGLMTDGAILEMEYQKSARHNPTQRPDIVFHIPAEHSGASVQANNLAVWALKRRASIADAQADFRRLDEMFSTLMYPVGFFVNIDAIDPLRQHYTGAYPDRLAAVAAILSGGRINVCWALPDTGNKK